MRSVWCRRSGGVVVVQVGRCGRRGGVRTVRWCVWCRQQAGKVVAETQAGSPGGPDP